MGKSVLLHPEPILKLPFNGKRIAGRLQNRAEEIMELTKDLPDQPLTIVIRTRNNQAYIDSLMKDIKSQEYNAPVEIILIDTESSDETLNIAGRYGAKIINIKQKDFSYPRALNIGFEAAKHPYVMSVVGHTNLSNCYTFKSLTYWISKENFGGIYCYPLANNNASRTERFAIGGGQARHYRYPTEEKASSPRMGVLGANAAIINKSAWRKMGGFDERYAGGGEDSALGHKMLNNGYLIVMEPLCTVLHSHGLGFIDNIRQLRHWFAVSKPTPFDRNKILKRRPDLRS